MMTLRTLKEELRSGAYAWPGGYAKVFIMANGEIASYNGVKREWKEICRAMLPLGKPGASWPDKQRCVVGVDVYWEGPTLTCCITNAPIESEYGDPDDT